MTSMTHFAAGNYRIPKGLLNHIERKIGGILHRRHQVGDNVMPPNEPMRQSGCASLFASIEPVPYFQPRLPGPLFSSAAMLAPRYCATREPSADCSCWPAKSWLGDPVHEMAF